MAGTVEIDVGYITPALNLASIVRFCVKELHHQLEISYANIVNPSELVRPSQSACRSDELL